MTPPSEPSAPLPTRQAASAPPGLPGTPVDLDVRFDNAYARLPEPFFARVAPTPVAAPGLLAVNADLAAELGIPAERLSDEHGVAVLAGSRPARGAEPLAMAYAGHQFGNWVAQLGDGRAILLGEVVDANGERREIQLKGAGRTPWSRGGDGRAGIGPVLREYVMSEAMHALGVPTTRALAAVATGETVRRDQALPGAVLTRVARSHVRVGTFQYFTARGDHAAVRTLMEHVIEHHYPELQNAERPALAFLEAVLERQAALVARWMSLGFIHGVMNTDNCSVVGDTIDYGPCAFMDGFAADRVFSSIDLQARYAWGNQAAMAHWNTAQLAQCLLPLIDDDADVALTLAQACINGFDAIFLRQWTARLGAKIGLPDRVEPALQLDLGRRFLGLLEANDIDFTLGFRALRCRQSTSTLFCGSTELHGWWDERDAALDACGASGGASQELMARANPVRIPRNHQVEHMIVAAQAGDLSPLAELQAALAEPFREDAALERFETAPAHGDWAGQTFCGT